MPLRPARVSSPMRCVLALCWLLPSPAFAQAPPWEGDLAAARRAYAAGDFAEAARAAQAADAAGFPDGSPPERLERAWRTAQPAIGCLWGLSVLGAGTDDVSARVDATDRVSAHCDARQQAVAALLLGDPLEAALRAGGRAFPAPFAHLTLPADAQAFADATDGDTLPIARDVDQAARFARAHLAASHGLDAECEAPVGFDWLPRRELPMDSSIEEVLMAEEDARVGVSPPPVPAPFAGGAADLALLTCSYGPGIAPEDRGFGDGREVAHYLLRRDAAGVRVVGSFRGFPMLECWTGVVQASVEWTAIPGTSLYRFVQREGYAMGDDEPAFVVDETTICDGEHGGCRTVPTAYERVEVEYSDDDEPVVSRSAWRGELLVEAGRIHLTEARRAPRPLRALGRATPVARFLAAPTISGDERVLFSAHEPPADEASAECPWEVADPDGTTNLRADARSTAAVVTTIPSGTRVVPVERRGRWWRVESPAGWLWAPNLRQACP